MGLCEFQLDEISSLLDRFKPPAVLNQRLAHIFIEQFVVIYSIPQFELDEAYAFEVPAENLVVVKHQFL